jgi:hypothetical protein
MVKLVAALHEVPKNADQIPAHCAADAPIVHLKQFLLCIDHQLMVDPDLTKLIFDHRNSQAMVFTQNSTAETRPRMFQQRCRCNQSAWSAQGTGQSRASWVNAIWPLSDLRFVTSKPSSTA